MTNSKKLNFDIEGEGALLPHVNSLVKGSKFTFVEDNYTVIRFLKKTIITVDENNNERRFYYTDFECWVDMDIIKIV